MMASSPRHRNWEDTPTELLGLILEKLFLLPDYIRFGAVCKGWRSAACENHEDRRRTSYQQPPMLLLPPEAGDEDHRRLYSIWERKIYSQPLPIPHTDTKWCCGYGWLAIADQKDLKITLLNPFSGYTIELPRNMHGSKSIRTVILSCDPCLNPNDWVVVVIYSSGCKLSFLKAGHGSWYYAMNPMREVVAAGFCKGQLYIMNNKDDLFRIGMHEKSGRAIDSRIAKKVKQLDILKNYGSKYYSRTYFVELEGDLLLIRRRYGWKFDSPTVGFNVFKFRFKRKKSSSNSHNGVLWIRVKDLGEYSLFLGESKPICIYAAKFPNCKPNCIYYTPDSSRSLYDDELNTVYRYDVGVFNMATRCISRYNAGPSLEQPLPSESFLQQPMISAVWFSAKLG